MSLSGRFQDLFGRVFRRPSDTDVDEEMRAHLQVEIDENVGAGMSPEEANYAARRKFGNVALFKEMTGEVWRCCSCHPGMPGPGAARFQD